MPAHAEELRDQHVGIAEHLVNALVYQLTLAQELIQVLLRVDQLVQQRLRAVVQLHHALQTLLELLELPGAGEAPLLADQLAELAFDGLLAGIPVHLDSLHLGDVRRHLLVQLLQHARSAAAAEPRSQDLRARVAVHLADEVQEQEVQLVQQVVHELRELNELVATLPQRVRLLLRVLQRQRGAEQPRHARLRTQRADLLENPPTGLPARRSCSRASLSESHSCSSGTGPRSPALSTRRTA